MNSKKKKIIIIKNKKIDEGRRSYEGREGKNKIKAAS
jgi:hypothetical protein